VLEPVQQRIERRDVEPEPAARPGLDEFREIVAVTRPGLDERQDQQFGTALLQLPVQGA